MHGPWPLPCLATYSQHAKMNYLGVFHAQARATRDEVGLLLLKETWHVTHLSKKASLEHRSAVRTDQRVNSITAT